MVRYTEPNRMMPKRECELISLRKNSWHKVSSFFGLVLFFFSGQNTIFEQFDSLFVILFDVRFQ